MAPALRTLLRKQGVADTREELQAEGSGFQKGRLHPADEKRQKRLCEVTFLAGLGGQAEGGWREDGL